VFLHDRNSPEAVLDVLLKELANRIANVIVVPHSGRDVNLPAGLCDAVQDETGLVAAITMGMAMAMSPIARMSAAATNR
jgi:hypothetical protein